MSRNGRRGETIVDNRYGWLNVEYRRTEFWNKNTLRQQRNRGDVKKKKCSNSRKTLTQTHSTRVAQRLSLGSRSIAATPHRSPSPPVPRIPHYGLVRAARNVHTLRIQASVGRLVVERCTLVPSIPCILRRYTVCRTDGGDDDAGYMVAKVAAVG